MTTTIASDNPAALAERIRGWAREFGFQQLGISDIDLAAHEAARDANLEQLTARVGLAAEAAAGAPTGAA